VNRIFNLTDIAAMQIGVPAQPSRTRVARGDHSSRRRLLRPLLLAGLGVLAVGALAEGADAAAVKAAIKKQVLTVTGTREADAITLRLRAGNPNVVEVDVAADGTPDFRFDRTKFSSIVVDGLGGSDTLVLDHSNGVFTDTETTTLNGGDGADTVVGSAGAEKLDGGAGDDFVDGQQGTDAISLGDGADVVQWEPGDGSDTIVGGTGADRLAFIASNASENFVVSRMEGGQVRLTRDVANVTLDLDDLEVLDLRSGGSIDNITIGNLSGTDVTEVRVDLAAFGGGDDGQADKVIVPPGVLVGRDGPAAVVTGLGAQVRVLNGSGLDSIHVTGATPADVVRLAGTVGVDTAHVVADGTDVVVADATPGVLLRLTTVELLDVELGDGDDVFTAVGNVAALVRLDVDGGDGNDNLLGGNGADMINGGPGDDFVDGQQGADTLALGDGADTVQWDPGDGSDTIVGGTGADRLVFNGSAGAENMALTAVGGGHVRFTRDLGNIVLDLDDVEVADVRTFGNIDTLSVGDLTGTELTEVRTDLALFGGGDDGHADEVIVNATAGADTIAVSAEGSEVVVQGLPATFRVANGTFVDRLTLLGGSASDAVKVAGTTGPDSATVASAGTHMELFGITSGPHLRLAGIETFGLDLGGDDQADSVIVPPGVVVGRDGATTLLSGLAGEVRVSNGTEIDRIHVSGSAGVDMVGVVGTAGADTVHVVANGTDVVVVGATPAPRLDLSDVETLDVDLGGGDDSISAVGNLAALISLDVDGGDGNDTLLGSNGADVVAGGPGDDFVDGQQGADTIALGDGADVVQWDPGDGSDTVMGGTGTDRLAFNGSAGAENFGVSAVAGGHVLFTRDLGGIAMDLDDLEILDLRAFGNIDTVTVGDLTGTDMTEVRTDLAAFGGGDDGQLDKVIVPPGVVVSRDGAVAVARGLGAEVRVLNGFGLDGLHVDGGGPADVVRVVGTAAADAAHVVANGTDVVVDVAGPLVSLTAVETLDVDLLDGDDTFSAVGNLAALVRLDVDGGDGADTLLGGNGADVLDGGPGGDFVDGQQGTDTLSLGEGADVVQWDPGDGSDTVAGGPGADRLVFNGSGGAENFALSAVAAGHVRLTRDLGAITMDLDDVEVFDLRTFGNIDTVTVNDLTGTDLTEVRTDLALFGGGDDGEVDELTVNGTPGDDTIAVAAQGSDVVVQGLTATVRIAHAAPAVDRLTVNGLAGNDTITATPEAAALIVLTQNP
jgi:Ca2+-binding RTX toxin-like protein